MSEGDSNICKTTREGEWSNLPHDLLLRIANDLGLIEFLSFRGVCKDWRNATLKASREDKSSGCHPWFLMYDGEGSQCSLLSHHDKIYAINIPELDGATCLASYEGWLLLFRGGSLFFFCPFSGAKIELPNCPFTELSDHIAAFSSAPTSQDCMVGVINRISDLELELHMLCRDNNVWAKHKFFCHRQRFSTIRAAVFFEGEFNFVDGVNGLVTFDASNTKQWNEFRIVSSDMSAPEINYIICTDIFRTKDMRRKLGLDAANVFISTCGTLHPHTSGKFEIVLESENIQAATGSESRHLKGVWVLPRYHIPPADQSW